MLLGFVWASPQEAEGERVVATLRRAAPPDAEIIEPTAWASWQSAVDELFPKGVRAYWKNAPFDRLDDAVINTNYPPGRGTDLARNRVRHTPHGRRI